MRSLSYCLCFTLVLHQATVLGTVALSNTSNNTPAPTTPANPQNWWKNYPTNLTAGMVSITNAAGFIRPALHWSQIESTNYHAYVQNLLAIGCPELTLQDIVTADLFAAYAPMRSDALTLRYQNFKYWEANPQAVAELSRQRLDIDLAMEKSFHELLGTQFTVPSTRVEWRNAELKQQLQFLPVEKRDAVQMLLLSNIENDLEFAQLTDDKRRNEDGEELQRIIADYDRKRASLAQLLTPTELEQVDLACSWTAHNVRRATTHFHPTEAEYRVIFHAWQRQDENLARLHVANQDPGHLHEAVHESLRELLGESRYRQYRSTWWK